MTRPGGTVRRVTASLRERDEENLEQVAESTHLSQNDAIRQALATEAWVQETLGSGSKILVEDDKGVVREVQFVH
jgi:adenylate kinase